MSDVHLNGQKERRVKFKKGQIWEAAGGFPVEIEEVVEDPDRHYPIQTTYGHYTSEGQYNLESTHHYWDLVKLIKEADDGK